MTPINEHPCFQCGSNVYLGEAKINIFFIEKYRYSVCHVCFTTYVSKHKKIINDSEDIPIDSSWTCCICTELYKSGRSGGLYVTVDIASNTRGKRWYTTNYLCVPCYEKEIGIALES